MSRRNLLICFDAFGTLFKPKRPIAEQYGEVARSVGLRGFSDEDVQRCFRAAFKQEAKQNPNYGKATGLGAEKWWTNIIHNTFKPLIQPDQRMPDELAPKLLHRFWSNEGYTLFPDVLHLLRSLHDHSKIRKDQLVVGVISNSDHRVPDVLGSLGVRVSPLIYGQPSTTNQQKGEDYDIDFTLMSYDVGHEKPDKRIFAAAEEMLVQSFGASRTDGEAAPNIDEWDKIYVGDEYESDVVGAVDAGWKAVLIDRDNPGQQTGVEWLQTAGDEAGSDTTAKAVGFSSLAEFDKWQSRQP